MVEIGDFLFPIDTLNVLSDFGSEERFLICGDSLILYLYSSFNLSSNENKEKQLLSTERCQSISFFHYFETFLANLLNRKTKFNILFIQENEKFYKNNTIKLIRKLCIDYYIGSGSNSCISNNSNIQFSLINSQWWENFDNIKSYFLENMFSFIFILFPVDHSFNQLYQTEVQELFIVKTLEFFDYIVELNSVSFEGTCIQSIIYSKKSRDFHKAISYYSSQDIILQISQLFNQEFEKFENDIINSIICISHKDTSDNTKIQIFKSTLNQKSNYQYLNRIYCIYLVLLESLDVRDRGYILPNVYKIDSKVLEYLNQVSYENLIYLNQITNCNSSSGHLDYIDYKLFYQILIQIQSRLPNNENELNEIFGEEILAKCELIWNESLNSGGDNSNFKDFKLFSNTKDKENKLDEIIKEMKIKTIEYNEIDNTVYLIENDFINSVAPQANEYLKEFKSNDYPNVTDDQSIINTRFIDNYHYHNNRTIEPDAFSVSLKEYKFKDKRSERRASDRSADVFKKYADSLNDPRNILIINKLNATKEEFEKERLKKEKEDQKKSFKNGKSSSTPSTTLIKPKNERDKLLENQLNQDKKRFESELVECKSRSKLLKFLNSLEYLHQLPDIYLQYFKHLLSLFNESKTKLIDEQILRKLKEQQKTELTKSEFDEINKSFELNNNEKSQYYQLVQKYLRFFINNNDSGIVGNSGISKSTLSQKSIIGISKCLYEISKSFIGLNDLSNFINEHFQLKFKELKIETSGVDQTKNSIEFQLRHSAETLIRNTGATEDKRVRHFNPDKWQVDLLDIVDKRESALICASTSSGKTFISFYCFEQILKESNDGIVVFVCPTKALVNQMYAEVLGRYTKNYQAINRRPSNHKLVGVMTRDMRIDMEHCQILITVPQCLEILFLSVINVPFIQRVKYVVFDEVHQIASGVDGAVWERLLLLSPCPFLALSATIGNLLEFHQFLSKIDKDRKVVLINYQSRFNDLKNYFISKQEKSDKGKTTSVFKLEPLHPLATLDQKKTGLSEISPDLKLIAHEAIAMYQSFKEEFGYDRVKHLDPVLYFKDIKFKQFNLEKQHIETYQNELKQFYSSLPTMIEKKKIVESLTSPNYNDQLKFDWESDICDIVLYLQKENLLPCIFFNFNRAVCSKLAQRVNQEIVFRNTSPKITEEKKQLDFAIERLEKSLGRALDDLEPNDPDKVELERLRSKRASLDFLKPQFGTILSSDIEDRIKGDPLTPALRQGVGVHHSGCNKHYLRNVEYLFRGKKIQVLFATSGLAMGVNSPAKSVVFLGDSPYLNVLTFRQCAGRAGRRGFDTYGNVIFLGLPKQKINRLVNSRLSNIIGNSVVSPSLCLTLASRYDYSVNGPENRKLSSMTGNQNQQQPPQQPVLAVEKVKEKEKLKEKEKEPPKVVLDSWEDDDEDVKDNWDVDEVKENAPTTTTTTTLTTPKLDKEDIIDIQILKKSTKSLLNNSFFLGDPLQVQFQALFSFDYLFREGFITKEGVPIENFSGIVTHLSYLEPFNFTFVSLLKSGVFDNLPTNQKDCDIYIIHILSYLFCVQKIPAVYVRSPSILVLPELPNPVKKIVKEHNDRLLKTFVTYLYIYNKYLKDKSSDFLPLSSLSSVNTTTTTSSSSEKWNNNFKELKPKACNYKTGDLLSGTFKVTNLKELKTSLGSNTYFSTRILPFCEINNDVNSYLLDFHKHSQKKPLIEDNRIKESDLWTLLKDFSLILKVISTSLERRNPLSPITLAFSGVAKRFLKKFSDNFEY